MTSGIATMSKEIVLGTVDKFDWVQLASGINHPEIGKIIDMNDDIRNRTGVQDANVKLIPYNSYGDIVKLRSLIDEEKPDAILHFTDPHYWQWLYESEHEIRQQVPLLYYHIWDNIPDPLYNRNYYESCDWLGCISKLTYGIVNRVGKLTDKPSYKPLEDWQVSYVPHGINPEIFKPIDTLSKETVDFISSKGDFDFILFYNNRNIRRKQPSDVIYSYKLFCDKLPKDKAEKCLLLMHTSPIDQNGTDLYAVANTLAPNYNIQFITNKIESTALNELYNIADVTINIANNEGFGLTTAESIMAGTPIIATVTGGLQDQMGFNYSEDDYIGIGSLHNVRTHGETKHGEWAKPVWPSAININGSPVTPYIFDDRVDDNKVATAIYEFYEMGREERKRRGLLGREWALQNISSKIMCDKMAEGIETTINNFKPRERYNLYKVI